MYQTQFSDVTAAYLTEFNRILNEMIQQMTTVQLSNSISYNFIVQMIPHHQAAIQMSQNLLNYTTNIPLQIIAKQIIAEQTQSIQDMQSSLFLCSTKKNSTQEVYQYQENINKILQIMFTEMKNTKSTNRINVNFIREMIPLHQGAVNMSETVLQYPICYPLIHIVHAILLSQKRGIEQLNYLLLAIDE